MSDMKLSEAPMPLSHAIRLGAMLRPQIRGTFFAEGGSCANGAAIEAAGVPYDVEHRERGYGLLRALFPIVTTAVSLPCGHFADAKVCMLDAIPHLNDTPHRWTREAIADWVETIEQAQSSALVPRNAENINEELAMVNK